jgi:hypothetical protein
LHAPCTQLPVAHDAAAFGKLQAALQTPQSVSVLSAVSQPLFGFESQLSKPPVQVGLQPLAVQLVVPWPFVHTSVHDRQCAVVPSAVSQPAAAVQSPKPLSQAPCVQTPVPHVAAACGNAQVRWHMPQSVRVLSGVSQPFAALPSQSPQPMAQVGVQPLAPHAVVP